MNHQGENPNMPRERQPSGPRSQQPTGRPQQQPTGQPQQRPYQWQQQQLQQPQGQRTQQTHPHQGTQPQQPQRQPQQSQPSGTPTQRPQATAARQPQAGQQSTGVTQAMTAGAQARPQPTQQMGIQRPRFKPANVEDLITTDVVTAQRDTPIRTVVSSMSENNVGSVVILDDDGTTPIDIITDRKIALALEGRPNIADQSVEELLTGDLIVGRTDMTVFEALDQLSEATVRRLPIVDEDGALQGIVTLDDLLVFLGEQLSSAFEVINAQSRR